MNKRSGNDQNRPNLGNARHKLRIKVLGEVQITLDERPVTGLPSRKAEALLIYLASHQRPFSREILADLLWDDRPPKQALANLRAILSGLRRQLGDYLILTRQTAAFNHDKDVWLDTAEFIRLLAVEDQRLGIRNSQRPAPDLQAAIALYRGDFLAGFYIRESRGFEEWAVVQRERWRRAAVSVLRHLVTHFLETGQYAASRPIAERLLTLDPLSEESHRQMMMLLARAGQHNAALQQYQTCRRCLDEELGVAPTAETTALYQRIRSARATAVPSLPPPTTPFVGRENELDALCRQLSHPDTRLITLLGSGGVGKTRLALETARQISANQPGMFLHGIRYVPMTAVPAADFLLPALADALRLPAFDDSDPLGQIANFLREKEALLLLDNFEHLLDAADSLAGLLAEAPYVKLLVTSQERLNLREEWVFDLAGLAYPVGETAASPESFAGVQLFLQQARRLRRDFQPDTVDWLAIARICQLVDGLPLGIEMAATVIRRHACPDIAAHLAENLDFLSHSARNMPPRHRNLRAVFDYSWQLLSDAERIAVAQLTVFRGPMSRESAQQVAQASPDMLAALVDKSLLSLAENDHFTMHALVRQFAAETLAATPNLAQSARERHGRYYAQFLQQQAPRFHRQGEPIALSAIAAELEDIRAAWDWALRHRQWETVSQSLASLHWFYWITNRSREGAAVMTQAMAAASAANAPPLLLARLQFRRGAFLSWLSRFDEAQVLLEKAIAQLRRMQAEEDLGWALLALGDVGYFRSDFVTAGALAREALALFRQMGNPAGKAFALNNLGNVVCEAEADYATGSQLYKKSLAIHREAGNLNGQAKRLINLGANAQMQSDWEQARRLYQEGIAICREVESQYALAVALNNLGQLEADLGDYEAGQRHLLASLDIKREMGERRSIAVALKHLGAIAFRTGHQQQARGYFDEALLIGRALASLSLMADVLVSVAELWAAQGMAEQGVVLLTAVREQATHDQEVANKAAEVWAEITVNLLPESIRAAEAEGKTMSLEVAVAHALADLRSS